MKRLCTILGVTVIFSLLMLPALAAAAPAPSVSGTVIRDAVPAFYDDYDADGVAEGLYWAAKFDAHEAVGTPGQRTYKPEAGHWISGWYDPQASYWYQRVYDVPITGVDVDSTTRQAWFTVDRFRMKAVDGGSPWRKDSFYQDDVLIPLNGGNISIK